MKISATGTVPAATIPANSSSATGISIRLQAFAAVDSEQLELKLGERHDVVRQFAHALGDPVRRRGVDPLRWFIVVSPTIPM